MTELRYFLLSLNLTLCVVCSLFLGSKLGVAFFVSGFLGFFWLLAEGIIAELKK